MKNYAIVLVVATLMFGQSACLGFGFPEYKEMIHGFLTNIGVDEKYMTHLLGCLTDQPNLEVKFVELMDRIDKLDFTNLPLTAELFSSVYYDIITMSVVEIDLCSNPNDDYDKLFQKIYHMTPSTIFKRLMLNFISNGQQTFKDIQDCIDNYLAQKYRQLGLDLGDIMHLILIYHMTDSPLSLDEFISLARGLLHSLNVHGDVEQILKCITKVPEIVKAISAVIEVLKKFDIQKLNELVQVLIKLFDDVKKIIADLAACAQSVEDLKTIVEKLSNLDFITIVTRISSNFALILSFLMTIQQTWEKRAFEKFGEALGNIIYRILLDPKLSSA
jgi:hypothetical protein